MKRKTWISLSVAAAKMGQPSIALAVTSNRSGLP
jgi:hypothetical protein